MKRESLTWGCLSCEDQAGTFTVETTAWEGGGKTGA